MMAAGAARICGKTRADYRGEHCSNVGANCCFNHFDLEGPWQLVEPAAWGSHRRTFDIAHISMMLGSIYDWPSLYRNIYQCVLWSWSCSVSSEKC